MTPAEHFLLTNTDEALRVRLRDTFNDDNAIVLWLLRPHPMLGAARSPMDEINDGKVQRVYDILEALDSGAFI